MSDLNIVNIQAYDFDRGYHFEDSFRNGSFEPYPQLLKLNLNNIVHVSKVTLTYLVHTKTTTIGYGFWDIVLFRNRPTTQITKWDHDKVDVEAYCSRLVCDRKLYTVVNPFDLLKQNETY